MTKKNLFAGLLALTLLPLIASPAKADRAVEPQQFASEIATLGGFKDVNRKWAAPWVYSQGGVGTTCNLIHTGKGIVVGLHLSADVAGSFVLYDTITTSGMSAATIDTLRLIGRFNVDTTKYDGEFDFASPLPYASGLVACPSASTVYSTVRYYKLRQ